MYYTSELPNKAMHDSCDSNLSGPYSAVEVSSVESQESLYQSEYCVILYSDDLKVCNIVEMKLNTFSAL